MMRATIILTGAAVLVAAMLGRMGWLGSRAAIDATLNHLALLGPALILLLLGAGLVFGLPILLVIGVVKLVLRLFRGKAARTAA